jgi:hypothetical protein
VPHGLLREWAYDRHRLVARCSLEPRLLGGGQRCRSLWTSGLFGLHDSPVSAKKKAVSSRKPARKVARMRAKPGAPSTQDLYTGMSGQFVAMSEFLWRGYNVALPAVDVGEDIFVVEAENGVLRRVQVKTAGTGTVKAGAKTVRFTLSRSQLNLPLTGSALFYMLLARWDEVNADKHWRFILIRWDQLNTLRTTRRLGRGRPPAADAMAGDELAMNVTFTNDDARAWGHSLKEFLDRWPLPDWPIAGPMKARAPVPAAPTIGPAALGAVPLRAPFGDLGTTQTETAGSVEPLKRP